MSSPSDIIPLKQARIEPRASLSTAPNITPAPTNCNVGGGNFDNARITGHDVNSYNSSQDVYGNIFNYNYCHAGPASGSDVDGAVHGRRATQSPSAPNPGSPSTPPSSHGSPPLPAPTDATSSQPKPRTVSSLDPETIIYAPFPFSKPNGFEVLFNSKAKIVRDIWIVATASKGLLTDPELYKSLSLRQSQTFTEDPDAIQASNAFFDDFDGGFDAYLKMRQAFHTDVGEGKQWKEKGVLALQGTLAIGKENLRRLQRLSSQLKNDTSDRRIKKAIKCLRPGRRATGGSTSHDHPSVLQFLRPDSPNVDGEDQQTEQAADTALHRHQPEATGTNDSENQNRTADAGLQNAAETQRSDTCNDHEECQMQAALESDAPLEVQAIFEISMSSSVPVDISNAPAQVVYSEEMGGSQVLGTFKPQRALRVPA